MAQLKTSQGPGGLSRLCLNTHRGVQDFVVFISVVDLIALELALVKRRDVNPTSGQAIAKY